MSQLNPRGVTFNNNSLDDISGFTITELQNYSLPTRKLDTFEVSNQDRIAISGDNFYTRVIEIAGYISQNSRSSFDAVLSELKSSIVERNATLVVPHNGQDIEYTATMRTVDTDDVAGGYGKVSIVFICSDPYGYRTAQTTLLHEGQITSSNQSLVVSPDGYTLQAPIYTVTLNSLATLDFDGSDDYVTAASNITSVGDQLTVSTYIKFNAMGPQQIIGNRDDTGTNGFYCKRDSTTGNIRFGAGDGVNYALWRTTGDIALPEATNGTWNRLTFVYDQGTVTIYVNETSYAASLFDGSAITGSITDGVRSTVIGRYAAFNAYSLNGSMRELRVWKGRAFTSDEVSQLNNGDRPYTPDLEYLFTEGTGSTVADTSGNGNTGTISNATWSSDTQYGNETLSLASLDRAETMEITRTWENLDVLIVNTRTNSVTVNGSNADFSGKIPMLNAGSNTLVYDDGFTERDVDITVAYNQREL
jgi:hypothetical protein